MKRKVVQIDKEKCMGCGQCVLACRGGAINFEGTKVILDSARCDGEGKCVPICLVGAITFVDEED